MTTSINPVASKGNTANIDNSNGATNTPSTSGSGSASTSSISSANPAPQKNFYALCQSFFKKVLSNLYYYLTLQCLFKGKKSTTPPMIHPNSNPTNPNASIALAPETTSANKTSDNSSVPTSKKSAETTTTAKNTLATSTNSSAPTEVVEINE